MVHHQYFIVSHSHTAHPASIYLSLLPSRAFGSSPFYYLTNGATGTFSYGSDATQGIAWSKETERYAGECVTVGTDQVVPSALQGGYGCQSGQGQWRREIMH